MILKPNMNWLANQEGELPTVQVSLHCNADLIQIQFDVDDPLPCYRAQIRADGERCYEDSCVEIFIQSLENPNEYFNFEFNSRGFCLAAKGSSREDRIPFIKEDYSKIHRVATSPQIQGLSIIWALKVSIPKSLLGEPSPSIDKVIGNVYKCGDLCERPHYLSLYPIDTDKPDFHRPEFFKEL